MNVWSWQMISEVDNRNKNSLTVFHRRIIWNFLTQGCVKPPVTSPELKHHVLLVAKCSVQQQHNEPVLTLWWHEYCTVCVVNSSQCVGGNATAVRMFAVSGLWRVCSQNYLSVLFSTDECCTDLLLVVVKCVKCRVGLLFLYRTVTICTVVCWHDIAQFLYKHLYSYINGCTQYSVLCY